jgi:hypothetical protein
LQVYSRVEKVMGIMEAVQPPLILILIMFLVFLVIYLYNSSQIACITRPKVKHHMPKKNCVIGHILASEAFTDVAFLEGLPHGTAWSLLKKFSSTGSTQNKKSSSSPKKITPCIERSIINNV